MELYWSIYLVIALFSLFEINSTSQKRSLYLFYIAITVLFCLSFMRWERGTDWKAYYNLFTYGLPSWDLHTENGYVLFNKIIRYFTDNYTFFLLVQSLVYYSFLISIFRKINLYIQANFQSCPYLYCTLLLFLFSQNFAGIYMVRSTLAYIICIHAFFDALEHKKICFFSKILIAFFIHRSSLLFLIVYPLINYVELNRKFILILVVCAISLFSFSHYIEPFLKMIGFVDYNMYLGGMKAGIIGIIKWGIVLLTMYLCRGELRLKIYDNLTLIFLIGYLIYVWSCFFAPVAQRIAGLFMDSSLLWLPFFIIYRLNARNIMYIILVLWGAISLWASLSGSYGELYCPYKFFWDTFNVKVF